MKQWEYLIGNLRGTRNSSFVEMEYKYNGEKNVSFDELGKDGWELTGTFSGGSMVFKREIVNNPTQSVEKPVKEQSREDFSGYDLAFF